MKHTALTVLTLWISTFTLINSGVSSRDLFGAAIDQGQIGHLERKRRTLPGSQQTHKNSKTTEGSQRNPLEFSSLGHGHVSNKKHKKSQDLGKQSHKDVGITQGRRSIFGINKKGHKNQNKEICSASETDAENNIPETRRNIQNTMQKTKTIDYSSRRNGQSPHNVSMKKNRDTEAPIQDIEYRAENISTGNETKPENQTNTENTTKKNDTDAEPDSMEIYERSRLAKKLARKSLLIASKIIKDKLDSKPAKKESTTTNDSILESLVDDSKVAQLLRDSYKTLVEVGGQAFRMAKKAKGGAGKVG